MSTTAQASLSQCYANALSPIGHWIAEERIRALETAFNDLPDADREVISLSRFARLSRGEVARQMANRRLGAQLADEGAGSVGYHA